MDQTSLLSLVSAQRRGRSLARPFHADPAVHEADLAHVWQREWNFAVSVAELPKAGSYVTLQLGQYPVVVVRGADGAVRAFHNVCRHRGQRLCSKPSGQAAKLVCPYHRWTYEMDGRLLRARDMGPDFDAGQHGLKPVHCAQTTGMVFICLAASAPDVLAVTAAAGRYNAPYRMDELKVAHQWRIV